MDEMESLSHTKWECKYHVVFIPKYRRKQLYGELRRYWGEVLRKLAEQKESRIEEGHLMPDHVHMTIAIPPKYAVSQVIGSSKGRARFIWREYTASGKETLWDSISGPAAIGYRPWAEMQRRFGITSGNRSMRINDWIRLTCGADQPAQAGSKPSGRVSDPT